MMKTIDMGDDGLKFLQSVLRCGDFLGVTLADLHLTGGGTYTFLPEKLDPQRVSLQKGGLSQYTYDDDLRLPIVNTVLRFMQTELASGLCVEVASRRLSEVARWVSTVQLGRYFVVDETRRGQAEVGLYGVVLAEEATRDSVNAALDQAWPFQTIGMVTSQYPDNLRQSGAKLPRAALTELSKQTQYIFVSAYDGEGFVLWARDGPARQVLESVASNLALAEIPRTL